MLSNEFVHLSFSPSISIHWKTSEDSLRWFVVKPAINFGLLDERIDWSKYNFGDMIDPLYGYISNTQEVKNRETIMAPDFGAGMFFYGNKFFGGIYFQHITEPEVGSLFTGSPYPAKLTIHGGYLMNGYKWLGNFELIPSFIYEYQQESRTDLSVIAKYRKYSLGIGARPGSAFMFMAGFEYKFFKIGYSYDLSVTHAAWTVGSTHEIMIGFNFANRKEHKKIRTLDFPVL
jgi:type IX secretion system PorP/SprF family membrane protein